MVMKDEKWTNKAFEPPRISKWTTVVVNLITTASFECSLFIGRMIDVDLGDHDSKQEDINHQSDEHVSVAW